MFPSVPSVQEKERLRTLGHCQTLVSWEDISSAKGSGTESGSVMAETAASIESHSEKLEPEVVRMLVGLAVATGVIGALVLLS